MPAGPAAPQIALVAATYRRPEALATLIASLQAQTLDPAAFEVAVVVDGLDELEAAYRSLLERAGREVRFRLHHAFQPNAGQSAARHRAISLTAAPWLCIVDDDMDLAPGFLAAHLAVHRAAAEPTVVLGRVIPEEGWERGPLYEAVRTLGMLELHEALGRSARQASGYALVTQNVSLPRASFEGAGGFDERLRLGEDSELGLRLEFAGVRFAFSAEAAAVHRSRVGSYDTWLRRCLEYGRSNVYIHEKLGRDPRAHPLRNLVNGSRLNAAAVHALCWSDPLAFAGIGLLRRVGGALQRLALPGPAIATHKAILAIAYHLGVKRAWGGWRRVLAAERLLAGSPANPGSPT